MQYKTRKCKNSEISLDETFSGLVSPTPPPETPASNGKRRSLPIIPDADCLRYHSIKALQHRRERRGQCDLARRQI